MHPELKIPFVALGIPGATWLGIGAYWSFLRWTGEAPAYYVGSMFGLRGLVAAPLQVVTMVALAAVSRALLRRSSWVLLLAACACTALLAVAGDAFGMHLLRCESVATAHRVWDLLPHVVGPAVLVLVLCVTPRSRSASMTSDRRGSQDDG